MRFNLLARRIMAPVLGVALAVTVAACSSSSPSATSSGSGSAAASAPAATGSSAPAGSSPASAGSSAAVAQITTNWEKFFSSSTTASQKAALLQNGSTFAAVISTFLKLPLAAGIAAKVTKVAVNSSTMAAVTYDIVSSSGSSLLPGQAGTAVYQDGIWKVGDASLCGLLKLIPGGSVPPACNSAG